MYTKINSFTQGKFSNGLRRISKQMQKHPVNKQLLNLFVKDLEESGLTNKTITRHISNVDFYINEYLLYEDALPMESGTTRLDSFLGDFFIRKCMWSTPGNIKTTAASIKKFYKCMLDHNMIPKDDYDFLSSEIKDSMKIWQDDCKLYNDPDRHNSFFIF